ncbi:hypothetical protein KUH32_04445 [Thalassococcus sp. CAU 1522]|uniref:Uncharacterized protein n=1 Tax=Thalassococcus arenae TaxID=2851652 RepID=A0ABS6N4T3_9RHOB|nr:hypothetical protein [Thalassococcus arenae]MBV2359016.1 hypothetical protein [Thalassococcus arenae]
MSRRFIAGVLAVAIAITGFSANSARADTNADDVARFLAAATTLFIIGKVIQDNNNDRDRKKKKVYSTHSKNSVPRVHAVPRGQQGYKGHKAHRGKTLPSACLIRVDSNKTRYVMGRRCLQRNFAGADNLPGACRMDVRLRGEWRPAYAVRCLRDRGYRVAGY